MESYQTRCECLRSIDAGVAPEAGYDYYANPLSMTQATWSYPMTARVLVQAGFSLGIMHANIQRPIDGTETHIGVTDVGLGYSYGSRPGVTVVSPGYTKGDFQTSRFSMAYVTGSHNFKVGFSNYFGWLDRLHEANNVPGLGTVRYTFRNQVPVAVEYLATPQTGKERGSSIGLYAQDQWTLRRLTLNLGVRFDHMDQWVPAQTRPAGFFTPEFQFGKIDVVSWNDIAPRLGAAFDLFGTGKTAVKASIGRYVQGDVNTIAGNNNPAYTVVTSATRAWSDANGDYFPQESELGPLSNSAFGTLTSNQRYDRALLEGWGVRPHNWQFSVQVQQELAPGIGLLAGYFRTWYGSIHTTDNLRITPSDFDPFCVRAPIDARLPGGGGSEICGFYDLAPRAFGAVDNFVTSDSNFGGRTEIFNGVDIALTARVGRGGQLSGGVSTGQTTVNDCAVVDNPAGFNPTPTVAARPRGFCETTNPWRGQTQFKLNGVYPLLWDLQLSGVFQSLPGAPIDANYPATNAEIARTLGRNLGACGAAPVCQATAVVQLIERFSEFEDRLHQTDLRLTRRFPIGRARLNAQFDVYNVFNANTILAVNPAFGRVWPRPTAVLSARTFKFGAQLDF